MEGYKCGLCRRWLASKYSLERHVRLKHKSDLEENTLPVKKHKLTQENNNTHSLDVKKTSDQESVNNTELGRSLDVKKASDQESDNNTELGHNVYANNAGWVESDNKEDLDKNNSEGEESGM